MPTTVDELLATARRKLAAASFAPSRREAALLLGHVLGLGEAQVLARGERPVTESDRQRFADLLARRLKGEPFAYLTGEREFFGRAFAVDHRVLIPRPETEHLIEHALALATAGELPTHPRILDLGTGSGCLAITLALELAGSAIGVDFSPAALAVAHANAQRHGRDDCLAFVAADLAAGLELESFDLVVSNPPYIERSEASDLSPEILGFEPAGALFPAGGAEVLFGRLFASLAGLRSGVSLLFEIGHRQGPRVAALLQESDFELVTIEPDLAGRDRVVRARRR